MKIIFLVMPAAFGYVTIDVCTLPPRTWRVAPFRNGASSDSGVTAVRERHRPWLAHAAS